MESVFISSAKPRTILLILAGLFIPISFLYAQDLVVLEKSVSTCETTSEFSNSDILWRSSDGVCGASTKITFVESGELNIVSSIRIELLEGRQVQVVVDWVPDLEGVIFIDVYYTRFEHKGWGRCAWEPRTYMYTYKIHRHNVNPGAQISGDLFRVTTGEPSQELFKLSYKPASDYPLNFRAKNLKYYNGIVWTEVDIKKILFWYTSTDIDYYASGFGAFEIPMEVQDHCGMWYTLPPIRVVVVPSCYQDIASEINVSLSPMPAKSFEENAFELVQNETYTINLTGVTDFNSHYAWKVDGDDADILFDGNTLQVKKALGGYRIEAIKKDGRQYCKSIPPLKVFVGGHDITLEKICPIVLPRDLPDFGYKSIDLNDPILEHFTLTVISQRNVIVEPGLTLDLGAEIIIERPDTPVPSEDKDKLNYIQHTGFNEYGHVMAQSRSYFDDRGLPLQTQYKNLTNDVILASATLYDAQGRAALTTLSAPVIASDRPTEELECPLDSYESTVTFGHQPDFVKASDDVNYNYTDFDLEKEELPAAVGTQEGTLGWYYSNKNGTSTNERMNEPWVATTQYPYSRTLFHHDGSGAIKSATKPGDAFRAGGGNVGSIVNQPVAQDDPYLKDYLDMRTQGLLSTRPTIIEGQYFKTEAIDAQEMRSVSYTDKSGNTIISLYFGKSTTIPITKSYQFYDVAGRLIVSVSPNGVSAYNDANFSTIDKTEYTYNYKGWLMAVKEPDAGLTEYVYRKDGKIRFSQNAKQRAFSTRQYSYTHYDRSGRPIESGEYEANSDAMKFKSIGMIDILENTTDGGLPEGSGTKRDKINTFYDEPVTTITGGRAQRFVHGAVSYTQNDNITTWYSYDERGRVEWMVQDIKDFGIKTLDYRYGPTGGVQEIVYQKGIKAEQFSHYYEYDFDGRLSKAYTSRLPLEYKKTGELVNTDVLELQAKYSYYLHGPLKRIELARNLQGIDYVYTADGALKGINHADPARDPNQDGIDNNFMKDVFGMTADYYTSDYTGAAYTAGDLSGVSTTTYPEQHSGNIRALRWHSPVQPDQQFGYAFAYDDRYQLSKADWAVGANNTLVVNTSTYNESVPEYDLNGNIKKLVRKNKLGVDLANYAYDYTANTNKLSSITQSNQIVRSYSYNEIGQLKDETGQSEKHVEYDVTGKVTKVFRDAGKTKLAASFAYDDRGFRLKKTSYNENGAASANTWYVRDASGNVVGTYEEDLNAKTPVVLTELPIYGSGRIGLYKPAFGFGMYELADHLGNVRAVVSETLTMEALATMESEREAAEVGVPGEYGKFENIKRSVTSASINHTAPEISVDGVTTTISNPNEVVRINNMPGGVLAPDPIGPGIMLWVHPGDLIKASVYVKYADFDSDNKDIIGGLAGFLTNAFGVSPTGVDIPSIFSVVEDPGFALLPAWGKLDDEEPRAFLSYLQFDHNFALENFDFAQASYKAKIINNNTSHERLEIELAVQKEGFVYIYVSNETRQNMDVYFDDLRVTHTYSTIVAGGDYYPFGLPIEDRQIQREPYRYGYQGQFSERDKETGWNHFELREYDPIIGRWLVPDPMKQYSNPYLAYGNNPSNVVDPRGGEDWPFGQASGYGCTINSAPGPRSTVRGGDVWTMLPGGDWAQLNFLDEVAVSSKANVYTLPAPTLSIPGFTALSSLLSWGTAIFTTSAILRGDESEKYITLYRGVHAGHPDHKNALKGMAVPAGGNANEEEHNGGDYKSSFTSWSMSKGVANFHASKHGPGGVVLEKRFKWNEVLPSPDEYQEAEMLVPGVVRGARVGVPTGPGFPKAFGN